ncbi:MAG: SRPBCC family protein [Verrucomicrobiota bacterium]|nr:SRPBCC family protein [Verrucomicrobiota bacterium]
MPVYILQREQRVAMPLEDCWGFFSDPNNLQKITPPSLKFRVCSQLPSEIHAGMMIRYTVSPLFGIPMTWVTEITQVRKPHYFADEQRVGPYSLWHHEHSFRAISERETEVRDLIHYAPPFGPFGAILNQLLVRQQLARIFEFRSKRLEELARDSSA